MARRDCRGGYFVFGRDRQAAVIGDCGRDAFCLRVERSLPHTVMRSMEHNQADLWLSKFYTYFTISPSPVVQGQPDVHKCRATS
jgi:hypothetical protein